MVEAPNEGRPVNPHDLDEIEQIEKHLAAADVAQANSIYTQSRSDYGYILIERTGRDRSRLGDLAKLFYSARHYRLVAECFEQLADFARAGQMYEKAGDPTNAAEMYWRAKVFARAAICYEASGSFTKAAELWLRLKEPMKAGMAFERAGALFRAGECLLEAGRGDRAIPLLQKVPADDFNFRNACLLAAQGLHDAQMSGLAIRRLEMGIGNAPIGEDNAALFLALARIHMDGGRYDLALVPLEQLASWNFGYEDVSERLAACQNQAQDTPPQTASPQSIQTEDFDDERIRAGIDILQQHPLLAGLTLPQLRALYDGFDRQRIAAGEILIQAGATSDRLFVLIKGQTTVESEDGKTLATLGPGSWFGEMALVDDAPASASVRAASSLAVLSMKHNAFGHLLETHPDMAAGFYRHFAAEMARRLRHTNTLVETDPGP